MTRLSDRYPDLLEGDDDPGLVAVIAGLDGMRRSTTTQALPRERDRAISDALVSRAQSRAVGTADGHRPHEARRYRVRRGYRFRLTSLASAALVILAVIGGYLRFQAPTPASAAKVLHRAAAAVTTPPAGHVVHEVMTDTTHFFTSAAKGGAPGSTYVNTVEQWSRFTSDGTVDRFDLSWSVNGSPVERIVLNDQAYWFYDPKLQSVTKDPSVALRLDTTPSQVIWPKTIMTQPPNPAALRTLLVNAATAPDTRLLPQQTLDGRRVDVVQVTHVEPIPQSSAAKSPVPLTWKEIFTLYIDASSYAVRRIDQQDIDTQGVLADTDSLRLTTDETLPAAKVPARVFAFTPPPGVHILDCVANTCPSAPTGAHK